MALSKDPAAIRRRRNARRRAVHAGKTGMGATGARTRGEWKQNFKGKTKTVQFKCKKGSKGCKKVGNKYVRTATVKIKGNKYASTNAMVKGMHQRGIKMGVIVSAYRVREGKKGKGATLADKFASVSKEKAEAEVKKILNMKGAASKAKVQKAAAKAAKASKPTAAEKKRAVSASAPAAGPRRSGRARRAPQRL